MRNVRVWECGEERDACQRRFIKCKTPVTVGLKPCRIVVSLKKKRIVRSNIDSHMKQLIFKLRMSIQICEAGFLNKGSRKFEKMQLLCNTVSTRS